METFWGILAGLAVAIPVVILLGTLATGFAEWVVDWVKHLTFGSPPVFDALAHAIFVRFQPGQALNEAIYANARGEAELTSAQRAELTELFRAAAVAGTEAWAKDAFPFTPKAKRG